MSLLVKIGKKGKKILKKFISPAEVHRVSYTRRIERVKTGRRIVAMTFDDGPMDVPASPDLFGGRPLTDVILDTLEKYGARGTFDVIGDTSAGIPQDGRGALIGSLNHTPGEISGILYVVYTERKTVEINGSKQSVTRIISARLATSFERGLYYGKQG